jgi:hydrogenase maturation factor
MIREILTDIGSACRELGCLAVGGHTEVTPGIDRPIVAGAMVGEVEKDKLLTSGGARVGDMVLVTKGIAIEATAILAQERAREVRQSLGEEFQSRAAAFLDDPGLSVVPASRAAVEAGGITAMHDVTEGGIANALWEVAEASSAGIVVVETEIPRFWESTRLAERFQMNLLGAIGSGALVLTAPEAATERILVAMKEAGTETYVIGRVVERSQGVKLVRGQESVEIPRFTTDEVARVLSS